MFNSNDYALNREYRQRTMSNASHQRDVQAIKEEQADKSRTLHPATISLLLIGGSILALLIFFALPTSAALL